MQRRILIHTISSTTTTTTTIKELQKTVILGTAHILWKVLM